MDKEKITAQLEEAMEFANSPAGEKAWAAQREYHDVSVEMVAKALEKDIPEAIAKPMAGLCEAMFMLGYMARDKEFQEGGK